MVEPVPISTPSQPASDEATFSALYPELRQFAAAVGKRGTDPDDLVQDAVVRAMGAGGLGRLESPRAYLRKTILHLAMDENRRLGRLSNALQRLRPDKAAEPHYPSDLADLDCLDVVDRAILFLAHVEGLPQTDIAEQLELSHQAVRSRASRARNRLRSAIEEET